MTSITLWLGHFVRSNWDLVKCQKCLETYVRLTVNFLLAMCIVFVNLVAT